MNGCIFIPAAELIRMIDPPRPPSMIFGAPAITAFQVPVTLTSMTSRNDSGVISSHDWGAAIPAFATMTSRRPNSATPSSTAFAEPGVVTGIDHRGDDPPAGGLDQADGLVEILRCGG